ncbi:MAG: hypothetical protein ACMXX5_00420 [Candidatus Woesearchaeota archaeon]
MKKIFTVFLLIIGLLSISGCISSGPSTSSYMTGTQGVTMSFVTNNPPSTVYYDRSYAEDVSIEVEAFNRGTSPVRNVETFFAGYDPSIVDIGNVDISFSGPSAYRTRYNPEGGYDIGETHLRVGDLGNADTYDINLKFVYCYDYETRVGVQLCVDPNPHRTNREDSCTPATVSTQGQGAPIGVSSVEIESMPGNTRLKINIRHYGQGNVLRSSARCEGIPLREEEDYITFTTPRLGGITGNCITDTNTLKLRNGQASIICNFPLDTNRAAYRTILEFEIRDYKIKDSIQRSIKIINEESRY